MLTPVHTICIKSDAFYALIDEVVAHIDSTRNLPQTNKWIDGNEAMKLLNISSPTTLWKLRTEGKIRFSQRDKKNILYDRQTILEYIESFAKEKF